MGFLNYYKYLDINPFVDCFDLLNNDNDGYGSDVTTEGIRVKARARYII